MKTLLLLIAAALVAATGCRSSLQSTRTFRLPEGDAAAGRAAFITLQCTRCHTVAGADLPAPHADPGQRLALGGKVAQLRSYGDLLTAIVHPQRELSDLLPAAQRKAMTTSPMPGLNDTMTVRQLIDLVAFLQPTYGPLEPLYQLDYTVLP